MGITYEGKRTAVINKNIVGLSGSFFPGAVKESAEVEDINFKIYTFDRL